MMLTLIETGAIYHCEDIFIVLGIQLIFEKYTSKLTALLQSTLVHRIKYRVQQLTKYSKKKFIESSD